VEAGKALRRAVRKRGQVLTVGNRRYDLTRYDRIVVVGAGKATASMARAMEGLLGPRLRSGLVIVKHGHAVPTRRIVVNEAGHPLPDRAGLRAASRLRAMISSLSGRDLLIVLLSGGASSLMPSPVPGVSLRDKHRVTDLLLKSGATIREINTVRKHLSALKGGGLAGSTQAAIITLILSDVLGDDVSAIASGPTAPDPTTFRDAVQCLKRYRLWHDVPAGVRAHLSRGSHGLVKETPKPGAPVFRRVQHQLIGSNEVAVAAAERSARKAGLRTAVITTRLSGEASRAGAGFGAIARRVVRNGKPARKPCCIIAGGETTVTVKGNGRGGRAQEFAVAAAGAIAGLKNVWVAALGTDGTDGPTDVAGAVVDGGTMIRAGRSGVDLKQALRDNDTYAALKKLRAHITTGPTNTNVNDLYLLLIR
jgi:glycerate-2-kinase